MTADAEGRITMAGLNLMRNGGVRAGSAFALGVVTGLFLKETLHRMQEVVQRRQAHREHEGTVVYDENLPDSLERREPAPHEGQVRFGGTGALGVAPAAAATARETTSPVEDPHAPRDRP
jgi:hypothetical protein